MIARIAPTLQPRDWKQCLRDAVTDPLVLLDELGLSPGDVDLSEPACRTFSVRVPRPFLKRMRAGDSEDPLLRQVIPLSDEMLPDPPGYVYDAVGDLASAASEGVLHKYRGRALLITTGACAIHCRYCFRRHFPYSKLNAGRGGWEPALERVRRDPTLNEIILSGGDPLTLTDRRLSALVQSLDDIPHLDTLRIHTRLPVVIPERVNGEMLEWLGGTRLKTVVVIHANHARELDEEVSHAMVGIRQTGATVLNQAVLLRRINDTVEAQDALSRRLFQSGVLPYYLHLPDPVSGTAHFQVDTQSALRLMADLGVQLPGYLMPRLAREEAGRPGKTQLGWTPGAISG